MENTTTVTFTLERQITEELILSYMAEHDLSDTLPNRSAVAELLAKQILKDELKENKFFVRDFEFKIKSSSHTQGIDSFLKDFK